MMSSLGGHELLTYILALPFQEASDLVGPLKKMTKCLSSQLKNTYLSFNKHRYAVG